MKETRCYGCMRIKTEEGVCPVCGYDNQQANEPHQLPAGTVLKEQYLIGRVLGQGGFGITYMGWDLYLDIPVAIKEYFPNGYVMRNCNESFEVRSYGGKIGERFESNKKRFRREVKMLARFAEVREIVQVKTFFMDNNTAYIVMEYIEGTTLKDYVMQQGGRISREETYKILEPVMRALGQVHRAGLVHRDISPDNIMLLPDGRVKLLDFGAVRDIGMDTTDATLTKSTEAILKQGFGPIEQYQHHGKLGPWTDVYALCATIYFCLTGEVPSDAPERALGGEMVWFTDRGVKIPKREETTIQEGMALRVEERIPDVQTLYHRLFDEKPVPVEDGAPDPHDDDKHTDDNREDDIHEKNSQADDNHTDDDHTGDSGKVDGAKKKKRFLLIGILVAVLAVIAIAVGVSQSQKSSGDDGTTENTNNEQEIQTGQCGDDVYWELAMDTGVLTISGTGEMWDYDSFDGSWSANGDTEIDKPGEIPPWSSYCNYVKKIVFVEGVTSVGRGFTGTQNGYPNLTELDLGSVTYIGLCAFQNTKLMEIVVPESVTDIDGFAFSWNSYLEKIEFLGAPSSVQSNTLSHDPNLESVVFHGNPTWIGGGEDADSETIFGTLSEDGDEYPSNAVVYGPADGSVKTYCALYSLPFKTL